MVQLSELVLPPISTPQLGNWTVVPSGTAHGVLADGSDSTYVQIGARCRLPGQVLRVGFADPSALLPAGAKVYSVSIRDRVQSIIAGNDLPECYHGLRSVTGAIEISGQQQVPETLSFDTVCPSSPDAATWIDRNLRELTVGPGRKPWTVEGPDANLVGLSYVVGRRDDYSALLRYAKVSLVIKYQRLSSINVTGPASPNTATRPTITWEYDSPDSQPQQGYRVAVYNAAQVAAAGFVPFTSPPLQASGWQLGEDLQWTCTADLTDDTYTAYVQATSQWSGSGEFPTAIDSITWTRAATPANPPPSAVLSVAVWDPTGAGQVELVAAPGGTTPATTHFTFLSSRDNGVAESWEAIPSLTLVPADGLNPVTVHDPTAPLNVISKYRVIAYSGNPLVAATQPSNELSVTPWAEGHTLICPSNTLLSSPLPVAAGENGESSIKIKRKRLQGFFYHLGGPGRKVLPTVSQGPVYGRIFKVPLVFDWGEDDLWAAVDQLIDCGVELLFNRPNGDQAWVMVGSPDNQDLEEESDAPPGEPTEIGWRRIDLYLTEVARPDYY